MALRLPDGVVPRDEAFCLYWQFAQRRQEAFDARLAGLPAPWTSDPILEVYKFCNVFRVADRVTQDLLVSSIYAPEATDLSAIDRCFRTIVYRFFSQPETWRYLGRELGVMSVETFDSELFVEALDRRMIAGSTVYTGAFILCANRAFGHQKKHYNHAALFESLIDNNAAVLRRLVKATSLEALYKELRCLPLVGKFMAYQIAIDLNYGPDISFDESSFVAAGPGAERGIKKCFRSIGSQTPERVIQWVAANQEDIARHYGFESPTLFGRRLQSIDCQGLFCETDKYCRVALPELRSARSRIKASFRPSAQPVTFVAPPKWQLSPLIQTELPTAV